MEQKKFHRIDFRKSTEPFRGSLYKKRFLVPNAVTIGNMFCGFLSIMYATTDRFEKSIIAIGIAILLDGLDGRVARKLNATSKFGIEFDSFSDLISFGVAPAILIYEWCFRPQMRADEFGIFVCFLFTVCAACRLARFNVQDVNTKGFIGLPTPGAAGAVASLVNFSPVVDTSYSLVALTTSLMLLISYLMVSTVPFLSVKHLQVGSLKIKTMLGVAILIGLVWYNTRVGFLVIGMGYGLSGLLWRFYEYCKGNPVQSASNGDVK